MIAHLPAVVFRAAVALCVLLVGAGAFHVVRAMVLSRARGASSRLEGFARGTPAILAFSTPECVTCKAAQRPALRNLRERLGDGLQVLEVDAVERPDIARAWGVLSVPTTFVLDADGRPRQVNHRFASAEKLLAQLRLAAPETTTVH